MCTLPSPLSPWPPKCGDLSPSSSPLDVQRHLGPGYCKDACLERTSCGCKEHIWSYSGAAKYRESPRVPESHPCSWHCWMPSPFPQSLASSLSQPQTIFWSFRRGASSWCPSPFYVPGVHTFIFPSFIQSIRVSHRSTTTHRGTCHIIPTMLPV